jgi:polyisoprenoid-binding protein YceI
MNLGAVLRRPRTWLIAIPIVIVLAVVAGPFVYVRFLHGDAPERLSLDDTGTDAQPASESESTGSTTSLDGLWTIADGSLAGYRVAEVLFGQDTEAVGRTSDVTGELEIDGTSVESATFSVDMTTVASDENRRDNQFHERILDTGSYPMATFTLTEPISFETIPSDGEEVTIAVTGELTVRGVTNTVTFDLAARHSGDTIEVSGAIPVAFDDYDIPDASFGPATVEDHGEIEFLLTFEPA